MRIETLALTAFGPFTDRELDFSRTPAAVQLVYGPNEAGKSSTLRALIALLYGIPTRTGDAHVHDMTRLRIGARLRDEQGRELCVTRRKGAKHTLLDREEKPLDEALLRPLLGGLDEPLFRQMFGLDHERLREGAEALLRGGGQLGEVLFDASLGGRGVHALIDSLRSEAEALYKVRGRTPELNAALERLREQRKQKNDAMLSPQAFVEQQRGLAEARARREQLAQLRRELLAERSRLTRLLSLVPLVARRDGVESELARVRALGSHAAASAGARASAGEGGGTSASAREGLGELVRELERRYGGVRAFAGEEAARRAELSGLEREIDALRGRLGPGLGELAGLDTATRVRLRKLAEQERGLCAERAELRRLDAAAGEEEARLSAQRNVLGPVAGLRALSAEIEREDLVRQLQLREAELAKLDGQLARRLGQLGLGLELAALAAAALPGELLVEELERAWEEAERARERHGQALAQVRERLGRLEQARGELLAQGELATRAELAAARAARDAAFDLLFGAAPGASEALPALVRAHAARVQHADELADRLWREAQRAAELQRIEQSRAALALEHGELEAQLAAAHAALEQLASRWHSVSAGLGLHEYTPRSARPVLVELGRLREQLAERANLEAERGWLERRARERRGELAAELTAGDAFAGGSARQALEGALRLARERLEQHAEQARIHAAAAVRAAELAHARGGYAGRLGVVERELAALRERYRGELAVLGLTPGERPELAADELLACLDELSQLAQRIREANALRVQLEAGESARAALGRDLREAAQRFLPEPALPELGELGLEQLLAALGRLHGERREARRDELRLAEELEKLDEQLALIGDGAPLAALRADLAELDPHRARARREEIEELLDQQAQQLAELDQAIGRLEAGLERLEQVSGASERAEDYEQELARARALARRYLELRLALSFLGREVERYRSDHQQPVLKRASELFRRLTLQRFRGLTVDYDERDEPVLACVPAGGKPLRLGALSDGTRDQLYLALRVASIERYFEGRPPLPLILDDVLIHFDDARAAAALQVLAELAERTQVLFFTHHARMIELARAALGPGRFALHELAPREPARYDGPLFGPSTV